jgi:hypothetical protein
MRIFHAPIFVGYYNSVTTGAAIYTPIEYSEVLASVDMLHVGGYATQVSGTAPNIIVSANGSQDGNRWVALEQIVPTTALSLIDETVFHGASSDPNTAVRYPYVQIGINFGGTNVRCYLQIWVTGRDQSRRSRTIQFPWQWSMGSS